MATVDGLEVGKKVRDYFDSVRGPGAVWDFTVAQQYISDYNGRWMVDCSFRSSPPGSPGIRFKYQVEVDSEGKLVKIYKSSEEKELK